MDGGAGAVSGFSASAMALISPSLNVEKIPIPPVLPAIACLISDRLVGTEILELLISPWHPAHFDAYRLEPAAADAGAAGTLPKIRVPAARLLIGAVKISEPSAP